MSFREQLLVEFDLEIPFIREHLARVPDDKLDWKPHARSMTLGWLSTFLGVLWTWAEIIVKQDSFDVVKAYADAPPPTIPKTRAEIVAQFDTHTTAARAAIAAADEASMLEPWTFLADGKMVWTQPRWLVLRTIIMNHAVHHRAQLGVFLRLLDVPVPAVYNDSADEKGGMFLTTPGGRA
jgi:uncharacterized damage-inducible protein DinB